MTFCKVVYILTEARKVYPHDCNLIQVENLKVPEYPGPQDTLSGFYFSQLVSAARVKASKGHKTSIFRSVNLPVLQK